VYRHRIIHSGSGLRDWLFSVYDALSGWIVVGLVGIFTGLIAFAIDITEATISDYKFGYCSTNILYSRETCCRLNEEESIGDACTSFQNWGTSYGPAFAFYLLVACVVGVISSSITMLSKTTLPSVAREIAETRNSRVPKDKIPAPKSVYMAAGAGVPELKTILSGFVIPRFLGIKVLVLKAVGAVFAVASGLPLGKEAPLIHIGACVANLVAECFQKYANNGKQLREVIVAGSAVRTLIQRKKVSTVLTIDQLGRNQLCIWCSNWRCSVCL
jgi:chloride channel 3/4/5